MIGRLTASESPTRIAALIQSSYRTRNHLSSAKTAIRYRSLSSSVASSRGRTPRPKPWQRRAAWTALLCGVASTAYTFFPGDRTQNEFMVYKLISKEIVSSTASILTLVPGTPSNVSDNFREVWQRGIWNLQFKQPQIQIVRPYTPLPPSACPKGDRSDGLRFFIRKDGQGEVSNYLHRLPIGATIELRGPYIEYELSPATKQIVFFAGGTGIAPALQVAHAFLSHSEDSRDRKMHIYWANRTRDDCIGGYNDISKSSSFNISNRSKHNLYNKHSSDSDQAPLISGKQGSIVKELEHLKARYPKQLTVEYFVDEEKTQLDVDEVSKALSRFDLFDLPQHGSPSPDDRQVIVSGPDGFIRALAGPKVWQDGREDQGTLGGSISAAFAKRPHVDIKVWKV